MARKRGPIGRIRNIRNQDPSAIPLPYPKLIVPRIFHISTNGILIQFYDSQTNEQILDYDRQWEWEGEVYVLIAGNPIAVTKISIAGNPLQFIAAFASDPENDTLVIIPWPTGWRGQNGEWLAPSQTFIGPVV